MRYLLAILTLSLPAPAAAALCAARDLPAGVALVAGDVTEGTCGGDAILPAEAEGRSLARALLKGGAIRRSLLVAPIAVRRGERVVFSEGGEGFKVEATGIALADAGVAETVPVDCGDRRHPRRVIMIAPARLRTQLHQ